jgi:hypothetical protein
MILLTTSTEYTKTINIALELEGVYNDSVIFHCYWNGELNEKHLYSILSCYYFNVHHNKHKIILWLENNTPNQYNYEIEKYAEIKDFSFQLEKKNTTFVPESFYYNMSLSYYSDVVRYLLLYNYGGVWFDLDCFILRTFDPLFCNFGKEICVYQWASEHYPNGAIFISLEKRSEKMKKNIEYIIERKRGWGFQEADLNYDLPLEMLVLPCSWFDPSWISNTENYYVFDFFVNTEKYNELGSFFKGSFCYHWHNQWNRKIDDNSVFLKHIHIIKDNISHENKNDIIDL